MRPAYYRIHVSLSQVAYEHLQSLRKESNRVYGSLDGQNQKGYSRVIEALILKTRNEHDMVTERMREIAKEMAQLQARRDALEETELIQK